MSESQTAAVSTAFQTNAMRSFVQIATVTVLVVWCFKIVEPFVSVILWGLIIAIALYPAHKALSRKLGGRVKSSACIFVLAGLLVLMLPTFLLAESTVDGLKTLGAKLQSGEVSIPPPNESVASWPLIGDKVYKVWHGLATNLEDTLSLFDSQLHNLGNSVVHFAGGMAMGMLQFMVSLIVAGVFLVSVEAGYRTTQEFAFALVGKHGKQLIDLGVATIRSVANGVIGIAVIQAVLAAIGLVAMGVPAAGLWAGLALVLAIVQLPLLVLVLPICIWVFSTAEPVPATIFMVYMVVVAISDAFMKPLVLGRGVDVPMLVILLGAIGGMLLSGVIGLFLGAVVLAFGYQMLKAWMANVPIPDSDDKLAESPEKPIV